MKKTFLKTLLFLAAPLLLEAAVYLARPDVYPGYLPVFQQIRVAGLGLFYFAALFALASLIASAGLTLLRLDPEYVLPPVLFGLYLALTLNRLLPVDSGYSIPRILAFSVSLGTAFTFYVLIRRKKLSTRRLMISLYIFCILAAAALPHLFEFPFQNVYFGYLVHTSVFSALLFLPTAPLLLIGSGIFVLSLGGPHQFHPHPPAQDLDLAPYRRVILVAVDGLSPEVTVELARAGKMPNIARMMRNGVFGRLRTLPVPFSPLVWNSIYTGATPQDHGVMAFTYNGFAGGLPFLSLWLDGWSNSDWMHRSVGLLKRAGLAKTLPPALSRQRLQPALWNIVNQNGSEAIVVGGWTTYPPEQIRGSYVSDFALVKNDIVRGSYYPDSTEIKEQLEYHPDVSAWPEEIRRYVGKDERAHHVSVNLFRQAPENTAFLDVYYCAIDAFGHHYGTNIEMKNTSAAERARLIEMRTQIYSRLDDYLKDYLDLMDDRTLLVLVSDHGFHYDKRMHNYPVDGTLSIYGKGVAEKSWLEADVYSIAPTLTYALGIAPGQSFHGKPVKEAFAGTIDELPPRAYTPNQQFFELMDTSEFEREKMEELKDLQYINQ